VSERTVAEDLERLTQVGGQHPRVRQYLAVKRNTKPNPEHLTALEGLWELTKGLEAGLDLPVLFVCPELLRGDNAVAAARRALAGGSWCARVSSRVLDQMVDRDNPDGLAALARLRRWSLDDLTPGRLRDRRGLGRPSGAGGPSRIVVLDGLEVLGNVGTIARCADAVGADAVLLTRRRVRLTHPRLVHASMGASLTVPMVDAGVEEAIGWLAQHGYRTVLTDTRAPTSYRAADYPDRVALVLGSERYGVSREWYDAPHAAVSIPMAGNMDSLNVANAAVVVLFECFARQEPARF
jgi:TrmH family RNA methyltransferase